MLLYRHGFNVYSNEFSDRKVWAYSDDLSALIPSQMSPIGKFAYPYILSEGPLTEGGSDSRFNLKGSYSVTLKGPATSVLEFELSLES